MQKTSLVCGHVHVGSCSSATVPMSSHNFPRPHPWLVENATTSATFSTSVRFVILAKTQNDNGATGKDKTCLALRIKNEVGSLLSALQVFKVTWIEYDLSCYICEIDLYGVRYIYIYIYITKDRRPSVSDLSVISSLWAWHENYGCCLFVGSTDQCHPVRIDSESSSASYVMCVWLFCWIGWTCWRFADQKCSWGPLTTFHWCLPLGLLSRHALIMATVFYFNRKNQYIYIENVWGYLARKAHRGEMPFSAINVLKEAILREWSALPVSYLQNVVDILNV